MTYEKPHLMARKVGEDKLNSLVIDFCDKGSAIKAVLCSSLSQISLDNISINDTCRQGKTKVKKRISG